jgi:hypothetical protein
MKLIKSDMYDEVASEFPDDVAKRRKDFLEIVGRETTLKDEDIINMISMSEDDDDAAGWAKTMLMLEALPDLA